MQLERITRRHDHLKHRGVGSLSRVACRCFFVCFFNRYHLPSFTAITGTRHTLAQSNIYILKSES